MFHHWKKLVGENGDLADVIVGVLSLLSTYHKIERIEICKFFREILKFHYPDRNLYWAIESSLQIGVRVSSDLEYFEVPLSTAQNNLERLRKRVGPSFVEKLKPVADRLAKLVKENDP